MRGILSFEQELRATRLAGGKKKENRSNPASDPNATERPWQVEIEQVQQTLREVLRAVANLSGVEIPGLPADAQDDSASAPRLNINTLKDRLRNDLEGFSLKTTEELAKRAREQTRAALEAVRDEMGGHIEQAATELREGLQLPAQVDKLLQPSIEQSAARLEQSFTQKFEDLRADHERLAQAGLQSALSSLEAQISTLEQNLHQIRELKADSSVQASADLNSKVQALLANQESLIQERLQSAMSSVQAQFTALEENARKTGEVKADSVAQISAELSSKVEHLRTEQQNLIQEKLQSALTSVHARLDAMEQSAQQVRELKTDSDVQISAELNSKVEGLLAEQRCSIEGRLQEVLGSAQAQMRTLEESVRKAGEFKADSVAKLSAALNSRVETLLAERERLIQARLNTELSSAQANTSAQVAAELREQLQRPAQIEKLLEPCVEQAAVRLEKSFIPKIELFINEQDQLIQDRLQGVLSSVYSKVDSLEQSVRMIAELNADVPTQVSVEQQTVALESSISQKVERLFAEQNLAVQVQLQTARSSINSEISALQQKLQQIHQLNSDSATSAQQQSAVLESSISQEVERLFAEQERLVQSRLQTALSTVHAKMSSLEQSVHQIRELNAKAPAQPSAEQQTATLESAISKKVQGLFAEQERLMQGRLQTALSSIQAEMNALEQKMEQMRGLQAAFLTELSAGQPTANMDHAMKQAETSLTNGFKEFLDRSFSRIEGSLNSIMETPRFKPVQNTHAKLEALRKAIPNGSTDMLIRVQQALDNLDRLGPKDPLPAS
ncbi:MAG TPA: hypothetical protein VFZ27_04630 [Terriglobia bacterium]|nr:hypothetical protein [Terriglobia bacterium]